MIGSIRQTTNTYLTLSCANNIAGIETTIVNKKDQNPYPYETYILVEWEQRQENNK